MTTFKPVRLHRRGWPIVALEDRRWRWAASGRYLRVGSDETPCARCYRRPTSDGHDPCIGEIPGVVAACCGHGVAPGYVLLRNGRRILLPTLD